MVSQIPKAGPGKPATFQTQKQGSPVCTHSTPLTGHVSFLASAFLALGEEEVADSLEGCIRLWLGFGPLGSPSGVPWHDPHFFGGGG